jgi:hypothetical protein
MGIIAAALIAMSVAFPHAVEMRIIRPHRPHRIKPVSSARPPRADLRAQLFFICAFSSRSV